MMVVVRLHTLLTYSYLRKQDYMPYRAYVCMYIQPLISHDNNTITNPYAQCMLNIWLQKWNSIKSN